MVILFSTLYFLRVGDTERRALRGVDNKIKYLQKIKQRIQQLFA